MGDDREFDRMLEEELTALPLPDEAVAEGMPRNQAYEFAAQAVLGSARMMLENML